MRWIPADLAAPVGMLLRGAIVVLAVLFAAPLITGEDTGALSRLGTAVLLALALAAVPLLASVAVGSAHRASAGRVRPGEMVELGGRQGQVRAVTLLEVQLEDAEGAELRIPHLVAFLHPTRALGAGPAGRPRGGGGRAPRTRPGSSRCCSRRPARTPRGPGPSWSRSTPAARAGGCPASTPTWASGWPPRSATRASRSDSHVGSGRDERPLGC